MKCARSSCPLPAGPSGFCDIHIHEEFNRLRANPLQIVLPEHLAPIRTCRDEKQCSTAIRLAQQVTSLKMANCRLVASLERRSRGRTMAARMANGRLLASGEGGTRPVIMPMASAQRKPPARVTALAARSSSESNLWEAFLACGNGGRA